MKRIKILVVDTVDMDINGMTTVVMNIFRNINPKKFSMDFVVNHYINSNIHKEITGKDARVFVLNRKKNPLWYFVTLIRIVRRNNYEVIHVHGNSATMAIDLLAAKLGGCKKRIAHAHSTQCTYKKMNQVLHPLFEWCCTERLACSQKAGKWLYNGEHFTVIQNALNLEKYKLNTGKRFIIREQLGLDKSDCLIGHVGVINRSKNQLFAVQVLRYLLLQKNKNYHMIFVGKETDEDKGYKKELEAYIIQNGLKENVTFYGVTEDVVGVMSAMDLFLFPSIHEGLGIVMIEAQLLQLPVIASANVPREAKISEYCEFIDLEQPLEIWSEAVERQVQLKTKNYTDGGISKKERERFDISGQIKVLEGIYQ